MKKIIITALGIIMLSGTAVVAQDSTSVDSAPGAVAGLSLKSKRGFEILPQAGDWAIGISASAPLYYFGNLLNGNDDNDAGDYGFDYATKPDLISNYTTIFFKKFISSNSAYRVRLNIIGTSDSYKYSLLKDEVNQDVNYPSYVEDVETYKNSGFTLGLGKEMRRGSHRVQGVYGAEALLGISSSSATYEYGNDLSIDFPMASTVVGFGYQNGGERITSSKGGTSFFIGARGFLGAEYFFAPKMSIGGEFGYTLGYSNQGKSSQIWERFDPVTNSVVEVKRKNYWGTHKFSGISADNLNAAINLFLYF